MSITKTLSPPALGLGLLMAALCGACSSSASKSDAGGDTGVDTPAGNFVAGTLTQGGQPACITTALDVAGGQAQCTVTEQVSDDGGITEKVVPSCNVSAENPCWMVMTVPASCPNGLVLSVSIDPNYPTSPNPLPMGVSYSCVAAQ